MAEEEQDSGPLAVDGEVEGATKLAEWDIDPNGRPNPPTQKVEPAVHVDETRFGMTAAVLGGEMPEASPVWEGGDPGEATKLQDDTPEDYYWPDGSDPTPNVLPKNDGNADGVADGVVLDQVVNAAYPPGDPDPEVLSQKVGKTLDEVPDTTETPVTEPPVADPTPTTADPLGGDEPPE